MSDVKLKLNGTYDSIEAYQILEEIRNLKSDSEELIEVVNTEKPFFIANSESVRDNANIVNTKTRLVETYTNNAKNSADQAKASENNSIEIETRLNAIRQAVEISEVNVSNDKNTVSGYASQTLDYMNSAKNYSDNAESSETNAKISEDNAKESELLAKQYRDEALTTTPEGYNNLISKVDSNERRISALYDLGEGKTHRFETSTDEAYTKQIPSGAKCFDLKMLGGKSVVANQLGKFTLGSTSINGIDVTVNTEKTQITLNGTATAQTFRTGINIPIKKDHKYYIWGCPKGGSTTTYMCYIVAGGIVSSSTSYYDVGNGAMQVGLADGNANFVVFRVENGVTVTNLVFKPQCIDLTQMFGAGNEPTLEQCQQIFTEYIPYTEPTLVNHKVTGVVVRGNNLFDKDVETKSNIYCINASTVTLLNNNSHWRTKFIKIPKGVTKLTCSVGNQNIPQNDSVQYCLCNNTVVGSEAKYLGATRFNTGSPATNKQTFDVAGWEYIGVQLYDTLIVMFDQVQIEIGDTYTNYVPYVAPQTKQVPQAIRDIEGNGWSAGTVCNYVDTERKKFVKCVDRVDMGTLNWGYTSGNIPTFYINLTNKKSRTIETAGTGNLSVLLCSKYTTGKFFAEITEAIFQNGVISERYTSTGSILIRVRDDSYTNATDFKNSLQGVYLYYELATPQEIDIDLDDRFSAILCEGNGSITFEGSTDYKLPIANSEEFTVKLSEV